MNRKMKLKDNLELDSTIHVDQLNVGKRVEKDNTNTIPRLLVRATIGMMVLFREIRRLEESVLQEVDIFCYFGKTVCHVTQLYWFPFPERKRIRGTLRSRIVLN